MPGSEGDKTPNRRRPPVVLFGIPLFIGLIGLFRVMESPQFQSYRTVDVVQLLASGAGFGVALTGVLFMHLLPRNLHELHPSAPLKANVTKN